MKSIPGKWPIFIRGATRNCLTNPSEQIYETQIKQKDGTTHNVILNKAVIRNNEDKIVGIVGSINDITELKKTEKRLKKAQESMEISSHMIHKINVGIVMMDQTTKWLIPTKVLHG